MNHMESRNLYTSGIGSTPRHMGKFMVCKFIWGVLHNSEVYVNGS
jgi:hypothetical protein